MTATPALAPAPSPPRCASCGSQRSTTRYDFGAQQIRRCRDCRLLYIHPLPSEEETRAVYGETYFQNAEFLAGHNDALFGYADYVAERFNKQPQYAQIAREIVQLLPAIAGRRPRLLEVGCGFGYFLDVAFEENFDVSGLEFNPHAVDRLRRKYAFPITCGALEQADLGPASLDAAVLFDVIEHLRDPFTALDRLRDGLAPHGVLVLSTVDAESWTSRLIGKRLEDFRRTREHLFFFGRDTMRAVLARHGFDVVAIRSIGHTFDLAFLLDRLTLYQPRLFGALRRAVLAVGLGGKQIYINPLTKMIVFARRRP
jgi:SAM-dependent methyltransferase